MIHPYIDALLRLRAEHGIKPEQVARIVCPVPPYIEGIVCAPVAEKRRPRSDSHGRVSLQYTLAEALVLGRIGKDAYAPASLKNPQILGIADRIEYVVDASLPGPEQFKGVVKIELTTGGRWKAWKNIIAVRASIPCRMTIFSANSGECLRCRRAKAHRGIDGCRDGSGQGR